MIRVGQPVRAHADCPVRAPSTTRSRRRLISTREHASRVASDPRSLAVSVTGELIFSGVAYSAPSTSQQDAKADTHAAAQLQHLSTESPKVDPLTAAYTTPSRSSRECVTAQRWPQRPATSHARAQQCAPTPTNTQCTRGTASLTAAPPKVYVDSSDAEGPVQQQDLLQTEPAWTHQNSMVEAVATRPVGAVQTVAAGAPETDTRVTAQVHDSELQASAELGPATGDARVPSVQGVGVTQPTLGCPEPLTRAPLKVTKLGQPHLTEGSRASDASAPEQESASSDRPAPAVSSTDSAATRARAGACTSTMNRLSRPWAALQTSTGMVLALTELCLADTRMFDTCAAASYLSCESTWEATALTNAYTADAMADDVDGAHDGPSDEGDLQACLQELGFSPLQVRRNFQKCVSGSDMLAYLLAAFGRALQMLCYRRLTALHLVNDGQ